MIDEKLVDFKAKLIAEFGPPPVTESDTPNMPKPAAPTKKEPEKKVEEKK
jgi:hypothetical protein